MSIFVADPNSPLIGVVPDEWLLPEQRLVESSRVIVALHHKPARVGHCVIFPKRKHCPRLQDCDPDDLVAIGMLLPVVKRGLRIVTSFQCYFIVMRSGKAAGQTIDQVYLEVVPTIVSNPSFKIDWDPSHERQAGTERKLTPQIASRLVHVIRQGMGYGHSQGLKNVVYETNCIIIELVQFPSSTGHMTISPKKLSPDLEDCDPYDLAGCLRDLPRIAKAVHGACCLCLFCALCLVHVCARDLV